MKTNYIIVRNNSKDITKPYSGNLCFHCEVPLGYFYEDYFECLDDVKCLSSIDSKGFSVYVVGSKKALITFDGGIK